jgi:uncharacterized protein with GYD domain
MQKYIYLTHWTDQGAKDTSNSVHRATTAIDTAETAGARIYEVYWTAGPYDLVFMAEVPDHETAHAVTLALARNGNVRTHAMRAFDRSEMLAIVDSVAHMGPVDEPDQP